MLLLLFVLLTELRVAASEHSSLAAVTHNQGCTEVEMCLFVPWNITKLKKTYFFFPLLCPLWVPSEAVRKEYVIIIVIIERVTVCCRKSRFCGADSCFYHSVIEYPGRCVCWEELNANTSSLAFLCPLICLPLIDIQQWKLPETAHTGGHLSIIPRLLY